MRLLILGGHPHRTEVADSTPQDPSAQLEQLRRNSLIGPTDLKTAPKRTIPDRKMPSTAAAVTEEALNLPQISEDGESSAQDIEAPQSQPSSNATEMNATKAALGEYSFGAAGSSSEGEPILSSTEQAMESATS